VRPQVISRATALSALVALTSVGAACGREDGGGLPPTSRAQPAPKVDSLAVLRSEVDYLRAVSAEKDTLLLQVRETQQFIDGLDAELARLARVPVQLSSRRRRDAVDPQVELRESIRERLRLLADRIERSEGEARERAERARRLGEEHEIDLRRLSELDSSVARFEEIVRAQQERIELLVARIDSLEQRNAELVAVRDRLVDSVTRLVARVDSVFVHAGPRDELLRLGIAFEDGGKRMPFIGVVGRALVPARTQSELQFTVLDRRRDVVVPLPRADRAYRIVSAHDPAYLDPAQANFPVVRSPLRIADAERFWAQSRYLVLVELDR
jgi:hypothetical protein